MKNQYDIVTVRPAVSDGAHAVGDVMFNLTKVELPARAQRVLAPLTLQQTLTRHPLPKMFFKV